MLNWLVQNIGTILVAMVVIALCALIVRSMVRDRKQGKFSCGGSCGSGCGGNCGGCSSKRACSAPLSRKS